MCTHSGWRNSYNKAHFNFGLIECHSCQSYSIKMCAALALNQKGEEDEKEGEEEQKEDNEEEEEEVFG